MRKMFRKVPIGPTRERIYVNDIAGHYEDDPCEKEEMEAAAALLKSTDRAKLRAMLKTITFCEIPVDPTRKRIYLNDVAWYYEDDPRGKEEMEAAVAILKNIDFSKLEGKNKKAS
ncbi:hypothetical protein SAMN04488109_4761 [Chryseolinea serpens]|uniref:Uncharacterized protein n=1 Tax=Chryseolinea serpens TaxID=947013 RepID=A0A1M5UM34_9BACT|nr:hypothetical protein [Chryseolinea serpens]SHH63793.1 hypothetical protein SAMN04488109_4761 [Chryseolinea serpens]